MPTDGRLLGNLSVLVSVVETGNFARAAEALGLSPSGVSRAVSRLETRLGVRLLHRTTRSVTLTDEGERLYAKVGPLLSGLEDAALSAAGDAHAVRGRLRVSLDPMFSWQVVAPRLDDFLRRYPELEIEIVARDELGDLISEGIDVSVRFGEPPTSSLVARKLLDTRVITVATPAYLVAHGTPKTPTDLARHRCLQFRDPVTRRPFEWEFHRRGKVVTVETDGPLLVNDSGTMTAVCLAGVGIAQLLAVSVRDAVADGRLVELFPDWPDETFPLYAFYPSRRNAPPKVRAFVDFCVELAG
ncbi:MULTISPECIES: LysR family transcriptional regulator [unclassified Luteibacter]|uniref:LysR family transcriptional regulator n=1 Tax=unclassified Luteibacter TaxID=2620188 RepID=UPI0008D63B01|nr:MULTISPECIES: LysR family transcriptional regulator [unclassified Luteibacter]SEO34152.1 DNA-binding transcriptional regulator, LysR family [Luteibacter sp. UNC138MFCol5.1]SEW24371.1 DNA-binding transcriptional regulator, LysR family [Luteibacter sp. 329MFSha]